MRIVDILGNIMMFKYIQLSYHWKLENLTRNQENCQTSYMKNVGFIWILVLDIISKFTKTCHHKIQKMINKTFCAKKTAFTIEEKHC